MGCPKSGQVAKTAPIALLVARREYLHVRSGRKAFRALSSGSRRSLAVHLGMVYLRLVPQCRDSGSLAVSKWLPNPRPAVTSHTQSAPPLQTHTRRLRIYFCGDIVYISSHCRSCTLADDNNKPGSFRGKLDFLLHFFNLARALAINSFLALILLLRIAGPPPSSPPLRPSLTHPTPRTAVSLHWLLSPQQNGRQVDKNCHCQQ
jgi:hypothetical protein